MANKEEQSPLLQLHKVTAYRNNTKVMDQFSMKIDPLQHTAIVGPNGAGKSTFMQLLTHQLHPIASDNGIPPIRIFGEDRWIVAELRKRIGIISADMEKEIANNLKGGRISGKDVVLTGFFSSMQLFGHHRVEPKMEQKAEQALADIGASYLSSHLFSRMSAGEARRVLIARALVTDPDILILDEPTTALDIVARETCLQLIRDIANQGTTVLIVTHHLEEVVPEIENVILLKEGRAVFNGKKEEILTSEKLSTVYEHPLKLNNSNGKYHAEIESADG